MRSISRALVLYSLALFALALGAVSWLSYGAYAKSLDDQRIAQRELRRVEYEKEERVISDKFDQELLTQALVLRGQTSVQFVGRRLGAVRVTAMLGGLAADACTGPLAAILTTDRRAWYEASSSIRQSFSPAVLHIDEDALLGKIEDGDTGFFQINAQWGFTWKSHSLGENSLPFDSNLFKRAATEDHRFDDLSSVGASQSVRRVMLWAQVNRVRFQPPRPPRERSGRLPDPPPLSRDTPPVFETSPLWVVIHAASETTRRDHQLAALHGRLVDDLVNVDEQSRQQLHGLWRLLAWVNGLTFLAVACLAWFLTRIGLRPLIRMSDAVAKVSERDFRLQLGPERLPKELTPIAGRLSETLDQLRLAFEREKRAAADISHELRTPVAALLTTVEVALRKPRSAEQYRATLEEVRGTGKEMSQLVERMLTLAWLDAGGGQPRAEEFDAAELAGRCAALVRPLAEARGLTLRTKANGPVKLVADPDKVREILVNLLHNAVEYNRPDGTIDVEARPDAGGVSLAVSDTGIGIPPEARRAIFERFYRADPSRESSGMHAGLGLAIVREYVERLHGKIEVESAVGVGSTFRVWLPRQDEA